MIFNRQVLNSVLGSILLFALLMLAIFLSNTPITKAITKSSTNNFFSRNYMYGFSFDRSLFSVNFQNRFPNRPTTVAEPRVAESRPQSEQTQNIAVSRTESVPENNSLTTTQNNQKGMVTLSFDDGWESQEKVIPLLSEYGVKGTFYIITDTLVPGKYKSYMTESEVKDLYKNGHEIGSHTITHSNLTSTSTDAKKEITESKQTLEKLIGATVGTFAYPYGAYNEEVVQMVRDAGYTNARTANDSSTNGKDENIYLLKAISPTKDTTLEEVKKQIDAAMETNTWLIITFHEIDADSSRVYTNTTDFVKEVLKYVKEKSIPTVTVSEGVSKLNDITPTNNPPPSSSPGEGEPDIHLSVSAEGVGGYAEASATVHTGTGDYTKTISATGNNTNNPTTSSEVNVESTNQNSNTSTQTTGSVNTSSSSSSSASSSSSSSSSVSVGETNSQSSSSSSSSVSVGVVSSGVNSVTQNVVSGLGL